MAEAAKGIVKLEVTGDGRTAGNRAAYKMQVENILADKERTDFTWMMCFSTAEQAPRFPWGPTPPRHSPSGNGPTVWFMAMSWLRSRQHSSPNAPSAPRRMSCGHTSPSALPALHSCSACGLWARLFQVRLANFAGVSASRQNSPSTRQALQENGEKLSPHAAWRHHHGDRGRLPYN